MDTHINELKELGTEATGQIWDHNDMERADEWEECIAHKWMIHIEGRGEMLLLLNTFLTFVPIFLFTKSKG